jgi:hypothetical protein
MSNYLKPFFISLALLFALPAHAQYQQWPDANDVAITVIDDRGREFPQYPLRRESGADTYRAYLEAREGKNYAIRVHNRSDRRIGVVIAVDGRNIISGDKSRLRSDERMYVLNPYQQTTYEGWRTGKNWVNRFYFTAAEDSYADAWGDRTAMGVIAVAVFREKQYYRPWQRDDEFARPEARGKTQRAPSAATEEAGTGFGDKDWSPARQVDFEAEERAAGRYFIKYEWRETLCRKGVIRCDDVWPPRRPRNRFWDEWDDSGYAPYPPDYRD